MFDDTDHIIYRIRKDVPPSRRFQLLLKLLLILAPLAISSRRAASKLFASLLRIINRKGPREFEFRELRGIIEKLKRVENSLRHPLRAKIQKFGRKCESG